MLEFLLDDGQVLASVQKQPFPWRMIQRLIF